MSSLPAKQCQVNVPRTKLNSKSKSEVSSSSVRTINLINSTLTASCNKIASGGVDHSSGEQDTLALDAVPAVDGSPFSVLLSWNLAGLTQILGRRAVELVIMTRVAPCALHLAGSGIPSRVKKKSDNIRAASPVAFSVNRLFPVWGFQITV